MLLSQLMFHAILLIGIVKLSPKPQGYLTSLTEKPQPKIKTAHQPLHHENGGWLQEDGPNPIIVSQWVVIDSLNQLNEVYC